MLAVPFVDLLLAVLRRVVRGHSPFAPDKQHLHHRLLELGHSHRRAVLLLYFWSALLALGGVALSIYRGFWVVVMARGVGASSRWSRLGPVAARTGGARGLRNAGHAPGSVSRAPFLL